MTILREEERALVAKHRFLYKAGIDALTDSIIAQRTWELRALIRDEVKELLTEEEDRCQKSV